MIPSTSIAIDDIHFPKFTGEQLQYFADMVLFTKQERLNLDPNKMPHRIHCVRYASLISIENTYQHIIDCQNLILNAEQAERLEEVPFNERDILLGLSDVNNSTEQLL